MIKKKEKSTCIGPLGIIYVHYYIRLTFLSLKYNIRDKLIISKN